MKTLLILFLFFSYQIFSQDKHFLDSLKVLTQSKIDTVRFGAYTELTWVLKETNKEEALQYANTLLEETTKTSNQKWIAQGYNDLGIIYIKTGDLNKASNNIEKSLAIRNKLGVKKDIASSLSKLANIETEKGQYGKALEKHLKVLKIFEELDNKQYVAHTCNNIGQLYNNINNYTLSNSYLMKAYRIEKEINDVYGLPISLAIMGSNYSDLQQTDSALKYLNESKTLFKNIEDYTSYAAACNNIGHVYRKLGKSEKGIEYYLEAIDVSKQNGDTSGIILYENNYANVLIDEEKYDEAEKILLNASDIAIRFGAKESSLKIYLSLTSLYIHNKNSEKADFYFDKYRAQKDSIFSNETSMRFSEAQTRFEVDKKDLELAKNKADKEIEKNKIYITYGALGFFIVLFSLAIWAFIQKKKSAHLLGNKNILLENANHLITHQKEQLTEKQKEIVDSINYAKKIQNALLASEEILLENLGEHFILFKPKDIVSGDFTWATINDNLFYLACCDSTGHGVPGAFMSLLNIGFLSEAIKERNIKEPGKIFDYVRKRLIETIGNDDQKDGFDGILICVNLETRQICYAAANNSPLVIRNKEIIHLNTNKMPVGDGIKTDLFDTFPLHYEKGDSLYLYTDGYPDQFGGENGKKFKYKPLEQLLSDYSDKPVSTQKEKLESVFNEWRGNLEQVDDVCIIGVKL
ncbi:MAG: tetratricopeptide repeat protein [Burkholderiales bacterium]|nr:tetratricopeptide repeat protein [Bacteroidia bacterium]